MAKQFSGREVTAAMNEKIRQNVEGCRQKGIIPTLCIIRVGENGSDISYERGAVKRCKDLGIECRLLHFDEDVTQKKMLQVIEEVNRDDTIHGVLMFRPLPKHLDQEEIENALDPRKDVDCMTQLSMSGVFMGNTVGYAPCTAQACIEILDHYQIDCTGKRTVVIGRSLVVGKPVAMLMLRKNSTVTICHTRTVEMDHVTKEADIIIIAAGQAGVVNRDYVREGQIIIDVGINVREDGSICGDADYEAVEPVVDAITPVPGGVGSVTTSVLADHVVHAAMETMK